MVGLSYAMSGFDLARGCRFSTYAVYRIRREMLAAIAASDVIRVPADARRQLADVRASEGRRRGRGEPSNASLLAADAGVSAARVEQLRGRAEVVASLDEPVGEDIATLADIIPDVSAQSPDEAVLDRVLQRNRGAALRKLDRRTRAVIVMRYGLAGDAQSEHARIGARLGISPERSRQLEQHGLRRACGFSSRDRSVSANQPPQARAMSVPTVPGQSLAATPTRNLAAWVSGLKLDDVPSDVIERAKHLLLDGIACGLVGVRMSWSDRATDAICAAEGDGPGALIGTGRWTSSELEPHPQPGRQTTGRDDGRLPAERRPDRGDA